MTISAKTKKLRYEAILRVCMGDLYNVSHISRVTGVNATFTCTLCKRLAQHGYLTRQKYGRNLVKGGLIPYLYQTVKLEISDADFYIIEHEMPKENKDKVQVEKVNANAFDGTPRFIKIRHNTSKGLSVYVNYGGIGSSMGMAW